MIIIAKDPILNNGLVLNDFFEIKIPFSSSFPLC